MALAMNVVLRGRPDQDDDCQPRQRQQVTVAGGARVVEMVIYPSAPAMAYAYFREGAEQYRRLRKLPAEDYSADEELF